MKRALLGMMALIAFCVPARASITVPVTFPSFEMSAPAATTWPKLYADTCRILDGSYSGNSVHWKDIETSRGVYVWTNLDAIVTALQLHCSHLLYTFNHVPAWANASAGDQHPPTDFQDYVAFVAALATRYKGQITYYEPWNEFSDPNNTSGWSGTVAQMYTLIQDAYSAIRSVDPAAMIVLPSATSTAGPEKMRQLLALGAGNYADVVNTHGYQPVPHGRTHAEAPEQSIYLASQYNALWSAANLSAKLFWVDEGSLFTANVTAASDQDAYTAIYMLGMANAGVSMASWFRYECLTSCSVGILNSSTGPLALSHTGITYREAVKWMIGATWTTALHRVTGTNKIRNTTATGLTPSASTCVGHMPTNWGCSAPDSAHGVSTQTVGNCTIGSDTGVEIIMSGTWDGTGSGFVQYFSETATQITTSTGEWWTPSFEVMMMNGTTPANLTFNVQQNEYDASGNFIVGNIKFPFVPTSSASYSQFEYSGQMANAGTLRVRPFVDVDYSSGAAFNADFCMVAKGMDNSTQWSGQLTEANGTLAEVDWDFGAGSTYTVPNTFGYFRSLDAQGGPVVGHSYGLTAIPVLFESAQWKGTL